MGYRFKAFRQFLPVDESGVEPGTEQRKRAEDSKNRLSRQRKIWNLATNLLFFKLCGLPDSLYTLFQQALIKIDIATPNIEVASHILQPQERLPYLNLGLIQLETTWISPAGCLESVTALLVLPVRRRHQTDPEE